MDDRALVAAMVERDPRGLEGAYRAYADRLLAYCRTMLRDPQAAADAVHDTFILASQRAGQLREPDRLRSWLYAIARNECLRQLRGQSRHRPLEEVGQVSAPPSDPGAAVHVEQLRELVWSAAEALNPGDRQVFELMVRHELSAADVGAVLGVSADHAHARLSRARTQLEHALGALLVARTGAADCAGLAGLLSGWNGVLNTLLRKRIGRHIQSCTVCAERRRRELHPAALLSAYATLPFLAVPAGLWTRIRQTSAEPAAHQAIAQHAGRFDPATGFPRQAGNRGRTRMLAAAALVLLVAAAILGPKLAVAPPAAAPSSPSPVSTMANSAPTQTPEPTGLTAPSGRPTPTRSRSSSPPAPSQLTVDAEGRVFSLACPSRYRLLVTAIASENPATATLHWSAGSTAPQSKPMTITGTVANAEVQPLLAPAVTWWMEVTTADKRRAATAPSTLANPCP